MKEGDTEQGADIQRRQEPRFQKAGRPCWGIQGLALGGGAVGLSLCRGVEEPGNGSSGLGCRSWPQLGMTSLGVVGISGTRCYLQPSHWGLGGGVPSGTCD